MREGNHQERRVELRRSTQRRLVAGSALIGFMIVEIVLRLVGYTYPVFYEPDQERGYALRPNMRGWYRREGRAYVEINSDGLRDREHTKEKPPDTIRLAVVGDSYAEALQVPLEETFWHVLEERLQACDKFAGRRIEVINFGVSGYGTAQELITLRERVWSYAPDIVMLAMTTNNDISDNSRALKKTDEIPYFIYRDHQLTLDNSFRETTAFRLRQSTLNRAGRWLRDNLRFVQAIHEAHGALKTLIASGKATQRMAQPTPEAPGSLKQAPATNGAGPGAEVGIDYGIYREPADDVWRDAWRVTEGLLVLMRDEVRSQGAKFLVVTLSNAIQAHPDPRARETFARSRLGVNDLFYPERRLQSLGEREGFTVLNLAPDLQRYAEQNKVFLHGFAPDIGNGHWNRAGHRAAGELMAQKICAGLVD